jgi:two-component system, OmpR family, response regulator
MEVKVLRWPSEQRRREQLSARGVPRLLVVEGPALAPTCIDILEDWVRPPITRADLQARTAALQARATSASAPLLDAHDVLHFAGRRLLLTPAESQLMSCFAGRFGQVVPREQLLASLWPDDDRPRRNALDLRVLRLRRRLAPLQLCIRTVRGRGYLLDTDRPQRGEEAAEVPDDKENRGASSEGGSHVHR